MKPTTQQLSWIILSALLFACKPQVPVASSEVLPPDAPEMQIEGASLQLLTKEPDIVTPTGLQIDRENRIWVIENHTHVRQEDYPGPEVDRILVFTAYIDGGEEKTITEFATDFVDGMSLSFSPEGKVLLSTRAAIISFEDVDGDRVADKRDTLISLETTERFPHNGMSGLVVSPDHKLYFQCGENFGANYLIRGTDGISLKGKEREGGSLYRCNLDGSGLERIGTAVWNCFAMSFDDYGNLFAVENDPDSRPPCRLLHIVRGGNYGFQFQHGRDGLSPLTSWFGQLPGTLPMVAGTGEAPSGLIYYNQDRLGKEAKGSLLVTAWGDNEIQYFPLEKNGSSFRSEAGSFVKGERNFYPVGLAMDDRGAVIASDWADVSYAVHGQGRIWRITNPQNEEKQVGLSNSPNKGELINLLNSPDPRLRQESADFVVQKKADELASFFSSKISPPAKLNLIWAAHNAVMSETEFLLEEALKSEDELLRAAAVRMMVDHSYQEDESFYLGLLEEDPSAYVKREAIYGLSSAEAFGKVISLFSEKDPFIHTAIMETFGKSEHIELLKKYAKNSASEIRLGALLCLRKSGAESAKEVLPAFLKDAESENRLIALKWIAEDKLGDFRQEVEEALGQEKDISSTLFDAYVVCFQYLDGNFNQKSHFMEGDEHVSRSFYKRQKFLLAAAKNRKLNYTIRSRALSGVNPDHPNLGVKSLQAFSVEGDTDFAVEAVRSLAAKVEDRNARSLIQGIAGNKQKKEEVRLEAIGGLARSAKIDEKSKKTLLNILLDKRESIAIRKEALRSIEALGDDPDAKVWIADYQKFLPNEEQRSSADFWREQGNKEGKATAGERIFFSSRYECSSCHRINGRGGIFGPDLSKVGSNADRNRIIEGILDPSDIVTPTYTGYAVRDKSGNVTVGRLDKDLDSKRSLQMILVNGERAAVAYDEIEEQKMLETSLMPANQHLRMTANEFRDLVQYLSEQK
ncbi:MAG: c-type cytochrome [Bacteroidia bacterium]|nr:c-type cytochrome [Bacteroidia bacterium]